MSASKSSTAARSPNAARVLDAPTSANTLRRAAVPRALIDDHAGLRATIEAQANIIRQLREQLAAVQGKGEGGETPDHD